MRTCTTTMGKAADSVVLISRVLVSALNGVASGEAISGMGAKLYQAMQASRRCQLVSYHSIVEMYQIC